MDVYFGLTFLPLFNPPPPAHSQHEIQPFLQISFISSPLVKKENVAEFQGQFMVRATLPTRTHTFLAKCSKISRGLRNFNELRRSVYVGKKMSTSWSENGRVVGLRGAVGIFVITDGCAVSEQGVGQKNQRINCEILATDQQISNEKTSSCLFDSDGF